MPYRVPAWAFRTIGTSTIALPRKTVRTAWYQFMPPSMSDDASMYVGMHADMLIQRAAIDQADQVRCAGVVGARSGLERSPAGTAGGAAGDAVVGCMVAWTDMGATGVFC